MTDTTFQVRFNSQFIQTRVERDDYRLPIEERLATLSGASLRLVCVGEMAAPPPPPPRRSKPAVKEEPPPDAPASLALTPEGRREETILTGLFGGRLEPIPAAPATPSPPPAKAPAKKAAPANAPLPDFIPFPGDGDAPPPDAVPFPGDGDAPPPDDVPFPGDDDAPPFDETD